MARLLIVEDDKRTEEVSVKMDASIEDLTKRLAFCLYVFHVVVRVAGLS
ncbi:MAG: hypothetical protein MSA90_17475 [Faecalicatena sp.]|nr:hypothetical protein [Faecalicatena sp.]MCI6467243.1 hypothetical protein [Faecalicatena sp.]MDY5620248.1 hypothetical protein [Lachnospiraceae bacterium]